MKISPGFADDRKRPRGVRKISTLQYGHTPQQGKNKTRQEAAVDVLRIVLVADTQPAGGDRRVEMRL